jgi:hypothetical protein
VLIHRIFQGLLTSISLSDSIQSSGASHPLLPDSCHLYFGSHSSFLRLSAFLAVQKMPQSHAYTQLTPSQTLCLPAWVSPILSTWILGASSAFWISLVSGAQLSFMLLSP